MNADDRTRIDRLRASLVDWALADAKRAASSEVDLPRLSFIGVAALLDTVARLHSGRRGDGRAAFAGYVKKYLPGYDSDILYHGLEERLVA